MLKELAVLISKLNYSDMMEWCDSNAFTSPYGTASERPVKMAAWAKKVAADDQTNIVLGDAE